MAALRAESTKNLTIANTTIHKRGVKHISKYTHTHVYIFKTITATTTTTLPSTECTWMDGKGKRISGQGLVV